MKKLVSLLFLLLVIVFPLEIKALSVSKNNLTMEESSNEAIDLYAEVDSEITEINFSLVYTSYDIPAYFNIESGLRDEVSGIKHRIIFSVPVTGKIKLGTVKIDAVKNPKTTTGSVNIHTAKALTTAGETINLDNQIINVNINKTNNNEEPVDTEENTPDKTTENKESNLLEKIESEIVKLDLKENVYEYTVNIKNDIEELDLKPIAKDKKYKVETTTQKISDLKDNQIIITVKDGDNSEEYKIKVNILKDLEQIQIDEDEFESTYKYKGKWIAMIVILSIALCVGLLLTKKK